MVTHAVQCDEKKDYRTAYYAYCEGLQLFVPLIAAETDAERRLFLQQVATNYMERAEEIKRSYIAVLIHSNNTNTMSSAGSQSDACSSTADNPIKNALKPATNFNQICMITKFQSNSCRSKFKSNIFIIRLYRCIVYINASSSTCLRNWTTS